MPKRAAWRRFGPPALLMLAGLALYAGSAMRSAKATELLADGAFETWPGTWLITGDVAQVASPSVSGNAVRLSGSASIREPDLEASVGATYTFAVSAEATANGTSVTLGLAFFDSDFAAIGDPGVAVRGLSTAFSSVSTTRVAPTNTAYVVVSVRTTGAGTVVYVDNASLMETLAPPTPTPTSTPTSTPTVAITDTPATDTPTTDPTAPSPTATDPVGDQPTTTQGVPTPTRTPTATKTATATHTPTAPKSPTAAKTPTAPKQTKSPTQTATGTPSPAASGFGGMLLNGDFEAADNGKPAYWTKFGGTVGLSSAAHGGSAAASLGSDTSSTKWLYQVVGVDSGSWYEVDGFARIEGSGEAFIRVSWYPSDDGSGSSTDQIDSDITGNSSWTPISTGPIEAPAGAASARVRLMLRPASEAPTTAFFDDLEMFETDAPPSAPDAAPTDTSAALSTPHTAATPRPGDPAAAATRATSFAFVDRSSTLRLSEFLSDPTESGRDSAYEWVELVNVGAGPASTAGWSIGDATSLDAIPTTSLPPGGYVVVAGSDAVLAPAIVILRVADGEIGSGLNNTGDLLRLLAPDGNEVDAVSFGDNRSVFDPPPPAPGAGATLGVRAPASDPDAANWATTDHPTPGEPNSFASPRARPPGPATAAAGAQPPAAAATVIVERRGSGSSTLLWVVIGLLALALLALGAFVLREPIMKLLPKKPS